MMSDLRTELIQVAAVAVSIIEDMDYGRAEPTHPRTAGPVLGIRRRATLTAEQIRRAADLGGLDTFAVLRGEAARAYADLLEAGERPVAGGSD